MTQQHPYCRTCGSMVRSKNVCYHCGCDPLKGHNYCSDCGTTTIPEAIMCIHCGASFQRKFPATLAILISIAVVVTFAGAGYFLSESVADPAEKIAEPINSKTNMDSLEYNKLPVKKNESEKIIINNIPPDLLNNRNEAINRLIKKLPVIPEPVREVITIAETPKVTKEKAVSIPTERTTTAPSRVSMNAFSNGELRNYAVGCSYFTGRSKSNVVFFTTNIYGYVKINGRVYALQGVQRGNDIARFVGSGYEVTIEIEGLAGNEKEWLAEASMVVKDQGQRVLSRHKIYSTCIDF